MSDKTIITGVLVDDNMTISFMEVCQKCNISEEVLLDMVEHGLVQSPAAQLKNMFVDQRTLGRIQSASRLQQDLGINAPGVVLVLELLDELEQVRDELSILQHHIEDN
jgi:chaperone modulatory protein CbpM